MDFPLRHTIALLAIVALLSACAGYNQSSIPNCPVRIRIEPPYSTILNPGYAGGYYRMDGKGYHYSYEYLEKNPTAADPFQKPPTDESGHILTDQYAYGYAGVIVVVGTDGNYAAYDLCCPKCLSPNEPLVPSWLYVTCPTCGEVFSIGESSSGGTGFPTKGIAKEGLKRYSVYYNSSSYVIQVYN